MRLASLAYTALKLAGVTTLARRLRSGGVILCYHNVIPDGDAGLWSSLGLHMPLATFGRHMRWLAAAYDVIPLQQVVERLASGSSLRGTAAVTFDDAYAGVFEHAVPLLDTLGLPATVFVVAQPPGGDGDFWWDHPEVLRAYSPTQHSYWLNALRGDGAAIVGSLAQGNSAPPVRPPPAHRPAPWPTIADAVRRGIGIGVHSTTHRSLPTLDEIDLHREVIESRDVIAHRTGVIPEFFAYPYGLWSDGVRSVVRSAGYRAAFTLEHRQSNGTDPWTIPRLNVPAGIGDAAFQAWTAGLHP